MQGRESGETERRQFTGKDKESVIKRSLLHVTKNPFFGGVARMSRKLRDGRMSQWCSAVHCYRTAGPGHSR